MTILQGTMQDGTVLPVQVDNQGRLVAQGLDGPQGPAGPTGPQGPKGDPGGPIYLQTAKPVTGTSVDFTGIPSWVQRITVMCNGVSTNGDSVLYILVGAGSFNTTSNAVFLATVSSVGVAENFAATYGIVMPGVGAGDIRHSLYTLTKMEGSIWMLSGTAVCIGNSTFNAFVSGRIVLTGPPDRIRLTSLSGVDAFTVGSFNVAWE